MIGRGFGSVLVLALTLHGGITTAADASTASSSSASASAAVARPKFHIPFACGTSVFMDSAGTHAGYVDKALDMYPETQNPYVSGYDATGWAVRPTVAGTVRYLSGSSTNAMYVQHNSEWRTMYAHMTNRKANNASVTWNEVVGRVGAVGTGKPHLHYEQQRKVDGVWQRVQPYFNGRNRALPSSGGRQILVSHNCKKTKPTIYCRYRVTGISSLAKRSWAGTKYDIEGRVSNGTVVSAGLNQSITGPTGAVWRRLSGSGGADGRGTWVNSKYLTYLGPGSSACPV